MTDAPTGRYDAVVFNVDVDGTLIDGATGLHMAATAMPARLDLPAPDLGSLTRFIGCGAAVLATKCLERAGGDSGQHPAALAHFVALLEDDPRAGVTVHPGVRDLPATLSARGLGLGPCTSKPAAPTRAILAALPLGPFHAVTGGDTLPVRRPDAAPLLNVTGQQRTTPARSLHVGDSVFDGHPARAADVDYAHVAGGFQHTPIADLAPRCRLDRIATLPELFRLSRNDELPPNRFCDTMFHIGSRHPTGPCAARRCARFENAEGERPDRRLAAPLERRRRRGPDDHLP